MILYTHLHYHQPAHTLFFPMILTVLKGLNELAISFQWVNMSFVAISQLQIAKRFVLSHATNFLVTRRRLINWSITVLWCTLRSRFFLSFQTHAHALWYECSPYRSFVSKGTKNCVHCSELRDVHYVEVCLQR